MIQEMDKAPKEPEPGIDIDPADASPAQKGLASRTIQSRTFQRIHQQALRSLESSTSSNPTSPLLSPNTSMEGRLVYSPALTPSSTYFVILLFFPKTIKRKGQSISRILYYSPSLVKKNVCRIVVLVLTQVRFFEIGFQKNTCTE